MNNKEKKPITPSECGVDLALDHTKRPQQQSGLTPQLDAFFLHRYLGFPLMVLCFAALFAVSFTIGKPVSTWLGAGLDNLALLFEKSSLGMALPTLLMGLISDGILRGIGSALAFFPQMLIFYVFYTLVIDTGYAARISYLMHKPMSRINMHGDSFTPLIVGYSCNVPAIASAKSIPNEIDRRIIMLVSSFTPCSARFGVILYIAAAFFNPFLATLVMVGLIILSWLVSAVVSFLIKRRYPVEKIDTELPDLPPYQLPSLRVIAQSALYRTLDFLNRIKNVVIISAVIVWALSTFPLGTGFENSYAALFGRFLEPVGQLAGLNWRLIVALFFGFFAKETTLSTLGVLYHAHEGLGNLGGLLTAHISPLAGLAFLVIYMFYIPCVATVTTIRRETGSTLFAGFSILVSMGIGFTLGILVYNGGRLILWLVG
ncbi:MAG: nucleoside recognition domain-containing protein [Ignavibacteriales bacterium]